MDINILVESNGVRRQTSVKSEATSIPGVHQIHWYGERPNNRLDYYSLVHVMTGRALNKRPLTKGEAARLIGELKYECPEVDFDYVVDVSTAQQFYVAGLSEQAAKLVGQHRGMRVA